VVDYTRRLARGEMSLNETRSLEDCLAAANYLEIAGDVVSVNYITQGLRRLEHQLTISPQTRHLLTGLQKFVADSLRNAVTAFQESDPTLAEKVVGGKDEFNTLARNALEQLRRRLMADESARIRTFQMEAD